MDNASLMKKIVSRDLPRSHRGRWRHTRFVCGYMACDPLLCAPILDGLPSMFKVNVRTDRAGHWLEGSLLLLVEEASSNCAGSEAMLAKVSEALLFDMLRRYMSGLPEHQTGWLASARDPIVSRSLAMLHGRVGHPWCSPTGRDRGRVANGPCRSIARSCQRRRWPTDAMALQLAAQALSNAAWRGDIAAEVGYESEAAFNRAFKRLFGRRPDGIGAAQIHGRGCRQSEGGGPSGGVKERLRRSSDPASVAGTRFARTARQRAPCCSPGIPPFPPDSARPVESEAPVSNWRRKNVRAGCTRRRRKTPWRRGLAARWVQPPTQRIRAEHRGFPFRRDTCRALFQTRRRQALGRHPRAPIRRRPRHRSWARYCRRHRRTTCTYASTLRMRSGQQPIGTVRVRYWWRSRRRRQEEVGPIWRRRNDVRLR